MMHLCINSIHQFYGKHLNFLHRCFCFWNMLRMPMEPRACVASRKLSQAIWADHSVVKYLAPADILYLYLGICSYCKFGDLHFLKCLSIEKILQLYLLHFECLRLGVLQGKGYTWNKHVVIIEALHCFIWGGIKEGVKYVREPASPIHPDSYRLSPTWCNSIHAEWERTKELTKWLMWKWSSPPSSLLISTSIHIDSHTRALIVIICYQQEGSQPGCLLIQVFTPSSIYAIMLIALTFTHWSMCWRIT